MENSADSDWCFVSKSASSSMIENNSQANDNNTETENLPITNAPETQKSSECNEEKCEEKEEEKARDDASEGNSESSSDVELIDDFDGVDSLKGENVASNLSMLQSSLSLSMRPPPPINLPTPEEDPPSSEGDPPPPEEDPLPPYSTTPSNNTPSPLSREENQSRGFQFSLFESILSLDKISLIKVILPIFCTIILSQTVNIYLGNKDIIDPTKRNIQSMQDALVRCYGEQQLKAQLEDNDVLKNTEICILNEKIYFPIFKNLLDYKLKGFLTDCLTSHCDAAQFFGQSPKDETYLPIIIKQLQHFKLLPVLHLEKQMIQDENKEDEESEALEEMRKLIANLTSANEALKKRVSEFDHSAKSDDLIIAKSASPKSPKPNLEVMNIIDSLYSEIERLQEEVVKLRHDHKTKESDSAQNFEENLKPYIDDLVSTLSVQITHLQSSFANELQDLKHYNELIRNMTMELYNSSSKSTTEGWSWQEIKENVENIVSGTHQELKDKINAYQTLNFTDTLNSYVEDNKKNVEHMLNVINHYVGVVKEKTQEFLETSMPEMEKVKTNGFWNLMNNIQDKWRFVKGTVKEIAKKYQKNIHNSGMNSNEHDDDDEKSNWYFNKPRGKPYNEYHKREKSNWFFRRADQREKLHKKHEKNQDRSD